MAGTIACSVTSKQPGVSVSHSIPDQPLPERVLGKTGVKVPILGLGGAGQTPLSRLGEEPAAIAMIEAALALGIRYLNGARGLPLNRVAVNGR